MTVSFLLGVSVLQKEKKILLIIKTWIVCNFLFYPRITKWHPRMIYVDWWTQNCDRSVDEPALRVRPTRCWTVLLWWIDTNEFSTGATPGDQSEWTKDCSWIVSDFAGIIFAC